MARCDQMSIFDALNVLEMPVGSTMENIKKKYYELAMVFHPDKNPDNKEAEKRMKLINVAYEVCCKYVASKLKPKPKPKPRPQPTRRSGIHPIRYVTFTVMGCNVRSNISGVTITFV